jgi:hypothetical protein
MNVAVTLACSNAYAVPGRQAAISCGWTAFPQGFARLSCTRSVQVRTARATTRRVSLRLLYVQASRPTEFSPAAMSSLRRSPARAGIHPGSMAVDVAGEARSMRRAHVPFERSSASIVFGQSPLSSRDNERSASTLPPVWQRGQ